MKVLALFFLVGAAAYVVFEIVRVRGLVMRSKALIDSAHSFEAREGALSILVLGDSTAVGIGALSEENVAGRLAHALNASVENHAESGALSGDISAQLSSAARKRYDVVLIQVGANDVIRMRSLSEASEHAEVFLRQARELSEHVVLLTAGKIGEAPIFPRAIAWIFTRRAGSLRERFIAAAREQDALYVDLFAKAERFQDAEYAPDALHLSQSGYEKWFRVVEREMRTRWPEVFIHARD